MRRCLVAAAILVVGCMRVNPDYCETSEECAARGLGSCVRHACTGGPDAAPDAPLCGASAQCSQAALGSCVMGECAPCLASDPEACAGVEGRPHCVSGTCVECLTSSDCTVPTAPICGPDQICQPCRADAECAARGDVDLCRETGTLTGGCVQESEAVYVDVAATCASATGTSALPYCQITDALGNLAERSVIVVAAGTYEPIVVTESVTIVGRGKETTTIDAGGASDAVAVGFGGALDLRRAKIMNGAVAGVLCESSGCSLREVWVTQNRVGVQVALAGDQIFRLVRSVVSGNPYGGVRSESTDFEIVNNFIARNGSPDLYAFGGVWLSPPPALGMARFWSNTVYGNAAEHSAVRHVKCDGAITLRASLFAERITTSTSGIDEPSCTAFDSLFQSVLPSEGTNNILADPEIVDDFLPDLHLRFDSPCRDHVATPGGPADDIDGDWRDVTPDCGADEYSLP